MFIPFNITSKLKRKVKRPSSAVLAQQEQAVSQAAALEHDLDVINEQLMGHRENLKASVRHIDEHIIPMVLRCQPKVKIRS